MKKKIAVISTGNGGQSMAAYFSYLGYRVGLYAREQERVDMFKSNRFRISGAVECETEIDLISCDMEEVIADAYLIMVTTPAQYHGVIAEGVAPYLRDGQAVILNPGRTFGTMVFSKVLKEKGCRAEILLGETDTLAFTCRCPEIGRPNIYKIKDKIKLAVHKEADRERLLKIFKELFPTAEGAESILHTGFSNIGMIFHPMPILMNITRVEAKEDFMFYVDGISPLVAGILEKMDAERVKVAAGYGAKVPTAREWLNECYGSCGETLYEQIQSTKAYETVLAPTDIDTRYIFEDIMTGCVPTSCAGRAVGIETNVLDTLISWASILYNTDFRKRGRNEQQINFREFLT